MAHGDRVGTNDIAVQAMEGVLRPLPTTTTTPAHVQVAATTPTHLRKPVNESHVMQPPAGMSGHPPTRPPAPTIVATLADGHAATLATASMDRVQVPSQAERLEYEGGMFAFDSDSDD